LPYAKGFPFLRQQLPEILAKRIDVLSPRMIRIIEALGSDWRRLDERIEQIQTHDMQHCAIGGRTSENEYLVKLEGCGRALLPNDFMPRYLARTARFKEHHPEQ
jgi:hypothetical protein